MQTIDRLWIEHSNGKFGLSIQTQIWVELEKNYDAYINRVDWRGNQNRQRNYDKLIFNLDDAPQGHLPAFFKSWGGGGWWWADQLYAIVEACNLLDTAGDKSNIASKSTSDDIGSVTSIDSSQLQNLLKAEKWREADQKTLEMLLRAANREQEGWLDADSISKISCIALRTIDQLWVKYSNGHFGFSIQKRIFDKWQNAADRVGTDVETVWTIFGDDVGWRRKNRWITYEEVVFNISVSRGHLPVVGGEVGLVGEGGFFSLIWKLEKCGI